jgi:uncharacterized membrane protein
MGQDAMDDSQSSNTTLSATIERYIKTIINLRLKAARDRTIEDRIPDGITGFSGRMLFCTHTSFGLRFGSFSTRAT